MRFTVPLLARRIQVGPQHLVDQRFVRIQPRRPWRGFFRRSGQADVNAFCTVRDSAPYFR